MLYQPDSLKVSSVIVLTRTIILNDLVQPYHVHQVLSHNERDDLVIDRLVVNCLGKQV